MFEFELGQITGVQKCVTFVRKDIFASCRRHKLRGKLKQGRYWGDPDSYHFVIEAKLSFQFLE